MRACLALVLTSAILSCAVSGAAEESSADPVEPVAEEATASPSVEEAPEVDHRKRRSAIDAAVDRFVHSDDWREVNALTEELGKLGADGYSDRVVRELGRPAKDHDDPKVRKRAMQALLRHFAENERARGYVAEGLRDPDPGVRYDCAWHAGDLKLYGTHRRLRRLMNDPDQSDSVRGAATKSLAQLGEADVIVRLVAMMDHKAFMQRHMADLGAVALTGRSPSSFGDYQYNEGAFVSGGVEAILTHPHPVTVHEKLAKRHQAIADFCRWLEEERPEVFKHLYAPY